MTVKELKDKLKNYDETAEIVFEKDGKKLIEIPIQIVSEVTLPDGKKQIVFM